MSFHHHHSSPFDPFFAFPCHPASSPSHSFGRHSSLLPPPSPFDLFYTLPHSLHYDPFLLGSSPATHCNFPSHDLLELSPFRNGCPALHRSCQHEAERGRRHKLVAKVKSDGTRSIKYKAKIEGPRWHGFGSKCGGSGKVKLIKEVKEKRCDETWPCSYTCKDFVGEELKVCCPKEEKQDKGCCSHS